MAFNQPQGSKCQHKRGCGGKHHEGKWCWTNAELASLLHQKRQDVTFEVIAKTFTIDGFKRHTSYECNKKFNEILRRAIYQM